MSILFYIAAIHFCPWFGFACDHSLICLILYHHVFVNCITSKPTMYSSCYCLDLLVISRLLRAEGCLTNHIWSLLCSLTCISLPIQVATCLFLDLFLNVLRILKYPMLICVACSLELNINCMSSRFIPMIKKKGSILRS